MAAQKPEVETPGWGEEMEEGYRSEAETPSLDPEWSSFEVEGLDVVDPCDSDQ